MVWGRRFNAVSNSATDSFSSRNLRNPFSRIGETRFSCRSRRHRNCDPGKRRGDDGKLELLQLAIPRWIYERRISDRQYSRSDGPRLSRLADVLDFLAERPASCLQK